MLRRRADPEIANPNDADDDTPAGAETPATPRDASEDRLQASVTRFAGIHVSDVMTPRPDVVAISASGTVADLRRLMRETKYSRIPVYGENVDDIQGAVTTRDLLAYDGHGSDPLRPLVRPVLLVPESKKAADLLRELQSGRTTFAVVIDEYGGTAGVVSVEDIVEEIVGEIEDEYDLDGAPLTVEEDGAVVVSGRVSLDRLEQAIATPLTGHEDVDTVGGLVTSAFGRIPEPGEKTDWNGFSVEVIDAEHKRVNRARFRRLPPKNADNENGNGGSH
jgi:CBS domain containing-hemolysin-like protein